MSNLVRTFLIPFLMVSIGCAAKKAPMANKTIRTVQKMRVGVIDLNVHGLNSSTFFECSKNYPKITLSLDGNTREELSQQGWTKNKWIASLNEESFEQYGEIEKYSLLLLVFKNKSGKNFVRSVNFLSKQVRTREFSEENFTCENVYSEARLQVIDSHPPFADIYLDERLIGEAPLWTSLQDGTYEVLCKLPEDVFPTSTLKVPGVVSHLCKRGNLKNMSMEHSSDSDDDAYEKSQGWFLYLLVGAASIGGAILPFLIF